MNGPRILAIDDDPAILRALRKGLEAHGYDVETLTAGEGAVAAAEQFRPDVVLLDLVLPGIDGVEVCRQLRARSAVPILVLSAVGEDRRKVQALDEGADDYVVKPFSMPELEARIRVALRRSTPGDSPRLMAGPVVMDVTRRAVSVGGQPLHLTPREYELLRELLMYPGRVVTQRQLLGRVWGPEYVDDTHVLRTFIHQLRTKLAAIDAVAARQIVNEPGVGYRLEPTES